jgi:hypothetical protein
MGEAGKEGRKQEKDSTQRHRDGEKQGKGEERSE